MDARDQGLVVCQPDNSPLDYRGTRGACLPVTSYVIERAGGSWADLLARGTKGADTSYTEHPLCLLSAVSMSSDFLFVMPSFLHGLGSVIDVGGTFEAGNYNISTTPKEADIRAMASDWLVVGSDLDSAIKAVAAEPELAKK